MARDARCKRVELDASEPRARGHPHRHQAEEVSDAKHWRITLRISSEDKLALGKIADETTLQPCPDIGKG